MTVGEREREALSALMDGEAQELELRRSLDAIASNAALRERWRRQHQVSELLQSPHIHRPDIDVSERVTASLSHRPTLSRNPLWSMAVAASVTFAVVMGGQALIPSAKRPVSPLVSDIGGAVVPVMGAQPVQASLGTKPLSVTNLQAQEASSATRQVDVAYERLARDRYLSLNAKHADAAALSHPAPYLLSIRTEVNAVPEDKDSQ